MGGGVLYIFCNGVENCLLLGLHVKDAIEDEVVNIVLGVLVPRFLSILLEGELYFTPLHVQNYREQYV